jgi:hypothetical protein
LLQVWVYYLLTDFAFGAMAALTNLLWAALIDCAAPGTPLNDWARASNPGLL